ncbi:MAG TPA: YraN family protein [Gammaproteobacteria bacterium]|nr:YraN family protein [Gammaproteobacteria bacterium]
MGQIPERYSNRNTVARASGIAAEQLACDYLQRRGLELIEKNYRVKLGEIDLIMRNFSTLIFIEVRYRKNNFFGGALESITWHKQQRLIRAATIFSMKSSLAKSLQSRFDVVTLTGNLQHPEIIWIEDAFRLDS